MRVVTNERRQYKRFSSVPIKIYLKRDGEFSFTEMMDISVGGLQVRSSFDFHMYEEYECQIEIPLKGGKDLIYAKALVWRIEPDEPNMAQGKRFTAFKFTQIQEYDKVVISEYLTSFEEDVPYC